MKLGPRLKLNSGGFSPRRYRPSLYLSADRGVYQDAAVQFTAADESSLQIAYADQVNLAPGTDDFLICGWVWVDSFPVSYNCFCGAGSVTANNKGGYRMYVMSDGMLRLLFGDGSVSAPEYDSLAGTVTTGAWHFMAMYVDRDGELAGYVNGEKVVSGDISNVGGNCLASSASFAAGASPAGGGVYFLNGRIDSLMFFKKPDLSPHAADIIAWAYNSGAGRLCAEITAEQKAAWGAVSGWEFAEASGQRKDSWGTNHLDEMLGEEVTEIARAPGIVRAIAANGDGVSYWRDQSTGGKHATQITLAKRPALVTSGINSRPVIRGDGVDDYLGVSELSLTGAFAISAVFQCAADPLAWCVLCGAGGPFEPLYTYIELFHSDEFDEDMVAVRCNDSFVAWFVVSPRGADPHILTVTRDASDVVRVFLDGVESSRVIQDSVELPGGPALAGEFRVERILAHDGFYFPVDIAEFLVYDGEKTAAELARLHTYLARRYGITI